MILLYDEIYTIKNYICEIQVKHLAYEVVMNALEKMKEGQEMESAG